MISLEILKQTDKQDFRIKLENLEDDIAKRMNEIKSIDNKSVIKKSYISAVSSDLYNFVDLDFNMVFLKKLDDQSLKKFNDLITPDYISKKLEDAENIENLYFDLLKDIDIKYRRIEDAEGIKLSDKKVPKKLDKKSKTKRVGTYSIFTLLNFLKKIEEQKDLQILILIQHLHLVHQLVLVVQMKN